MNEKKRKGVAEFVEVRCPQCGNKMLIDYPELYPHIVGWRCRHCHYKRLATCREIGRLRAMQENKEAKS